MMNETTREARNKNLLHDLNLIEREVAELRSRIEADGIFFDPHGLLKLCPVALRVDLAVSRQGAEAIAEQIEEQAPAVSHVG